MKKENMMRKEEKTQHPFNQIFRVCWKEPLQCNDSNITLSFHGS
jgi:hypothetical protein